MVPPSPSDIWSRCHIKPHHDSAHPAKRQVEALESQPPSKANERSPTIHTNVNHGLLGGLVAAYGVMTRGSQPLMALSELRLDPKLISTLHSFSMST